MRLVEFWVLSAAGALVCPLPDVDSWTISPISNDAGAAEITYPVKGANWAELHKCVTQDRRVHLQVRIDGVIHPELQVALFEGNGDDVNDGATWSYRGRLPLGRLMDSVVKPKGGMPAQGGDSTIEQDAHYYSCTAGTIMATCVAEAKLRGAATSITTTSFSGTHDSNGVAWSQIITLKLTPGINLLKVLAGLVEAGMCDAKMVGTDLRLYEQGTVGTDRTLTDPPLVFRRGQSLTDSPRKHTTSALATAALVAGADGEYVWVSDAAAETRLGERIETSVSQGSIRDPGTLAAYAQHYLEGVVTGRMQKTHGGTVATAPVPVEDFDTGDWSYSALGDVAGLERLRVAQWVLSMGSDGTMSWQAVLNDLIAEREAAQARRLQGIEGGTTIAGTSNARQIPDDLIDEVEPLYPEDVTVTSVAYTTDEHLTLAAVTVEWGPVLFNANGTALTDLGKYSVFWRYQDAGMSINPLLAWTLAADTGETFAHFSGVRPGAWIDVRVGATDLRGNFSGWAPTVAHLTAVDDDPPPIPAAAILTPFIGTLAAEVTGLGQFGEVMPSDFQAFRVHVSTVDNFTPTAATLYDVIPGPGSVAITNVPYGVTQYVRVESVDTSGNISDPSAVSSAEPRQILNPDVASLSIGSAQIIDLDVAKVSAGTISSPWIIGSTVQTAETGPRFGFSTAEFFAYRADGTKTVSVTNAGAASFLGEIRTATDGARMVVNPGGTSPAEMRFYPADGSLGKYISLFTADIPGQAPGYSLMYIKGDRYAGLPGEAAIRLWYYEASFGWFDAAADILNDEESAFYARMYSCGINSSTILHTAHGLRSSPYHEFAFEFDTVTLGMGRMKRDGDNAFVIGCPAKGSAHAYQGGWIYAVAEGNTFVHVGFTASTVTQSSGRAVKTNIADIEDDVLAVLDAAPAKRWEYRQDHEPRPQPEPIRRRRPRRGPNDTGAEDELVAVELEPDRRALHRRWGPMAEDLPEGVTIIDQRTGGLLIDHGSFLGVQWEILRRLHGLVKQHEADLELIRPQRGNQGAR